MEMFLLAAITAFLLTSAIISLDQPRDFRTGTVARYIGAAALLAIILLFMLVGPDSPAEWSRLNTAVAKLRVRAMAISLTLGLLTGVLLERGPLRAKLPGARRRLSWRSQALAVGIIVVLSVLHLIFSYRLLQRAEFVGTVSALILAAIAGWLFSAALRSPNQPRNVITKATCLYLLGAAVLFAAIALFVARTTDWLDYWKTQISYRVTGREMLELVLGAAFGWLVRRWKQLWEQHEDTTSYRWAAGVLLALPLFAAVSPQFSALLASVTGLKTPVAEFQLAPSRTEYRAAFDVERDKAVFSPGIISNIEGMVDRDLKYADVLTMLKEKELPKYLEVGSSGRSIAAEAKDLVSRFRPLFVCWKVGAEELADPHAIEDALRPTASALSLLLHDLRENKTGRNKIEEQEEGLSKRKKQVMSAVGAAQRMIATLVTDHGPQGCAERLDDPKWPDGVYATRQSRGPYIHYLAATFQFATRNPEKALVILEPVMKSEFGRHPTLNYFFAFASYYGDRELDETLKYASDALMEVADRTDKITSASAIDGKRQEEFRELKKKMAAGEAQIKNVLAYTAAQAGRYEIMAGRYARENYEGLDSATYAGGLLEDDDRVTFTDTYGYVLMAFAARKSPIDVVSIQLAHRLLVDANSGARRLSGPDRRTAVVTVESHLHQAEKLLVKAR